MDCGGSRNTYTPETIDLNGNTINAVHANSNTCGCDSQNIEGALYVFPPGEDSGNLWGAVEHPTDDYWVYCCKTGMCQSKSSCPDDFDAYSEWECDFADAVKGLFAALGIMLLVIVVVIVLVVVLCIYCCCCRGGSKTASA